MKFDHKVKMQIARGWQGRYEFDAVLFDIESDPKAPRLVVTDGRMLASIPVQLEDGDPKTNVLLPSEAFKKASTLPNASTCSLTFVPGETSDGAKAVLVETRKNGDQNSFTFNAPDQMGTFPRWNQVVVSWRGELNPPDYVYEFALSADVLQRALDGINAKGSVLRFRMRGSSQPIEFFSSSSDLCLKDAPAFKDSPFGVVMPLTIDTQAEAIERSARRLLAVIANDDPLDKEAIDLAVEARAAELASNPAAIAQPAAASKLDENLSPGKKAAATKRARDEARRVEEQEQLVERVAAAVMKSLAKAGLSVAPATAEPELEPQAEPAPSTAKPRKSRKRAAPKSTSKKVDPDAEAAA
jgi:hypothetical protein